MTFLNFPTNLVHMPAEIGDKIRRARERKRMTQEDLAHKIGVHRRTVDNWENGRTIPKNRIGALEEVLEISLRDKAAQRPEPTDPKDAEFPRTDVGRELLELAGTDKFLDRVRELLPQLPADERVLVEELIAAYLASEVGHREDQERKRRLVDRIIRRRRGRGMDTGDNGGQAAAG